MRKREIKMAARNPGNERLLLLAYRAAVSPQGFLFPARPARQTKRKRGYSKSSWEDLVFKNPHESREFSKPSRAYREALTYCSIWRTIKALSCHGFNFMHTDAPVIRDLCFLSPVPPYRGSALRAATICAHGTRRGLLWSYTSFAVK